MVAVIAGALVVVCIVFVDAVSLMIACDVDIGVVACDTVETVVAIAGNLAIVDSLIVVVVTVSRGSFPVGIRVFIVDALVSRVVDVDVLFGVACAPEDATVLSVRVVPGALVVSLVLWRVEPGFVVVSTVNLLDLFVVRVTVGN